ncbi:hypothetical protein [Acinetobacter indicus]
MPINPNELIADKKTGSIGPVFLFGLVAVNSVKIKLERFRGACAV